MYNRIARAWAKFWLWLMFPQKDLEFITQATKTAEANTSGEIRVVIRYDFGLNIADVYTQAVREFERYEMGNTVDKTGVLVLVVVKRREFVILGDEGINTKVGQEYWDELASKLRASFSRGNYAIGIQEVLVLMGEKLAEHFPRQNDDTNELPDTPAVEV